MKKLLLFIVAVMFAAVTLPACSDDDEGNNNQPAQSGNSGNNDDKGDGNNDDPLIVGMWELVHFSYENNYGESGDYDVDQSSEDWHKIVIKTDGSFLMVYGANGGTYTGSYLIEGDTLKVFFDEGSEIELYTIKFLTATTLVLENVDSYGTDVYTYKRI